jgi:protein O-GlcNAc transferase
MYAMSTSKRSQQEGTMRRAWCLVIVGLMFGAALVAGCADLSTEARDLEREGDLYGATVLYRGALQGEPDDVAILSALAVDLTILGKYDEALPVQERVVALDRKDAQTRVELGFNYLNHQQRPEDAVRVLAEAVAIEPTAQHLSFLAQAQKVSGTAGEAEQTLRRALEVDPQYAYAYTVLGSLLVLQGRTAEAAQLKDLAFLQGVTLEIMP